MGTKNSLGTWFSPFQQFDGEQLDGVQGCLTELGGDSIQEKFAGLEALGVPIAMSRILAKLTEREATLLGVQLCPIAAHLSFWASPAAAAAFPALASVAVRLLSMHTTTCAGEHNWSLWGQLCTKARNRLAIARRKACFLSSRPRQTRKFCRQRVPRKTERSAWSCLGTRSRQGWQLDGV
jgi:hypothetical protein